MKLTGVLLLGVSLFLLPQPARATLTAADLACQKSLGSTHAYYNTLLKKCATCAAPGVIALGRCLVKALSPIQKLPIAIQVSPRPSPVASGTPPKASPTPSPKPSPKPSPTPSLTPSPKPSPSPSPTPPVCAASSGTDAVCNTCSNKGSCEACGADFVWTGVTSDNFKYEGKACRRCPTQGGSGYGSLKAVVLPENSESIGRACVAQNFESAPWGNCPDAYRPAEWTTAQSGSKNKVSLRALNHYQWDGTSWVQNWNSAGARGQCTCVKKFTFNDYQGYPVIYYLQKEKCSDGTGWSCKKSGSSCTDTAN